MAKEERRNWRVVPGHVEARQNIQMASSPADCDSTGEELLQCFSRVSLGVRTFFAKKILSWVRRQSFCVREGTILLFI